MKLSYYAIKVEDHIRVHRCPNVWVACHEAFGVIYDRPNDTAVYKVMPKSPKSMSAKAKHEFWVANDWLKIPPRPPKKA